ncbi:O-fucosyltransferase 8 isoform X2 [Punica granatum]|uniref:O-fucosyltransferase family protein n=1 Tax=Punica granatum TaxID=22663 RepID=A0A218WJF0_PUNGR|nr:O-fucosyltransferase 8 isoform X2 [Punica granatum]OWM72964.1 hypothetical protein CDL15_Pgr001078 [Punica granatum]
MLISSPFEALEILVLGSLMGRQGSPRSPRPGIQKPSLSSGCDPPPLGRRVPGGEWNKSAPTSGSKSEPAKVCVKGVYAGKRQNWLHRHLRTIVFTLGWIGLMFVFDSCMVSIVKYTLISKNASLPRESSESKEDGGINGGDRKPVIEMYSQLVNSASASLAKVFEEEPASLWEEPYREASQWKPCAHRTLPSNHEEGNAGESNGYIIVSANGGLNQQRVAICNAVAVASLLNATLVLPRFLYSNVWKDPSQFGDIYQEECFVKTLEDDIEIVKELPPALRFLNIEAIGSQITDADLDKEAKPVDYIRTVLPLLLKNGVVHFLGFGNRLGFDPLPFHLQRLRCKCNFHALKFTPKIQKVGALLVSRIRKFKAARSTMIDKQLLGNYAPIRNSLSPDGETSRYLALHLRFEEDMVAYSQCEFGGGESERKELQAYRESHFPLLMERLKNSKQVSPTELRMLGRCPLTPEEAALVLAGLGFKRSTHIYLAGSQVYGGESRMRPLTGLYPNLVTKETLLTPSELSPFRNFSSQLAALDFIVCATADVFAMTDSGSQLSSLVSGFRAYYGGGQAPTLRPNKKRLAAIMSENNTMDWNNFKYRVRKMIEEGQKVRARKFGRSIYRQPRCPECMCKSYY